MATKSDSKGFAIAALVLGIVGIVGSWIPFLNWFSFVLAILAVIFGILAVIKTKAKGLGMTGLVLGGAAIVIFIIVNVLAVNAVNDAVNDWSEDPSSWQDVWDDWDALKEASSNNQ